MVQKSSGTISVFEFGCQAPLKFLEHCTNCPRFGDGCPDLALGKQILRGRKKVDYQDKALEDHVSAKAFNCLAPLYYFERTRIKCAHAGRCREEGLLLALVDGKKRLDYSYKEVTALPTLRKQKVAKASGATARREAVS